MKKGTFNPNSSAWNRFRAKTNIRARMLMLVVGLILGTFVIGAIAQPHTSGGAASVMAMSALIGLPFAKRQGSLMKHYKEGDEPEGGVGKLSTEAEKSILDKVKEVVKEQIDKAKTVGLTEEQAAKFNAFFTGDLAKAKTMEDLSKMSAQLEELGLKFQSSLEKKKDGERAPGFFTAFKAAWDAKKSEVDTAVSGKMAGPLMLEVKAAIVMGEDNTIGAGATQTSLTRFTGIISKIRQRVLTYLQHVSVGTTDSKIVYWIEETDQQGTPIFIGEGDAKTQLSVKYLEKTATVKKIAVYGKVTTEMMADLGQLMAYIQNNLMKRADIKIEDQLIAGDGVGDNLYGVIPQASAFVAPASMAFAVQSANEYDSMEAIALQVRLAFGLPNVIFVNPATKSKMKTLKDSVGQYINPRWTSSNASDMVISDMTVVETPAITDGQFVGGDFSVINVLIRESATIQIGLDGNDFTNNVKTILMEQRLVQFISANDTQVLVKGTFAAVKAAIQQPT